MASVVGCIMCRRKGGQESRGKKKRKGEKLKAYSDSISILFLVPEVKAEWWELPNSYWVEYSMRFGQQCLAEMGLVWVGMNRLLRPLGVNRNNVSSGNAR